MGQLSQDVTDAELAVLQVLWDQGTATVRRLTEALYPEGTAALHATVHKILERLEAKECVVRDRDSWPHLYRAAVERDALIGLRLRAMAEKLCGGSLTPLLLHLLKAEEFTAQECRGLRAFVEELQKNRPKGRRQS